MEDADHIKKFLEKKLGNFIIPGDKIRIALATEIKKVCGIEIEKKNVHIQQKSAYIKASSAEKSVIFIKKREILKNLKGVLGDVAPTEIK